ncbi:MAG: hypothetical protein RI988_951 [Pseudomonadota bacterium]|jgi:translocation and assembly module TamB
MLASSALSALLAGLAGLVVLPLSVLAMALLALRSEAGTAWLLPRLPGIEVRAVQGALLGPRFAAGHLRVTWAEGAGEVVVEGLRWEGAKWRWWLAPGVWAGLRLDTLHADAVRVRSPATPARATPVPLSLEVPLALEADAVSVDSVAVDGHVPVRALRAALRLQSGAPGGIAEHRLERLSFDWDRIEVRSGRAELAAQAPFQLRAAVQASGRGAPSWQAQLEAEGPLAAFMLQARLRGVAPAGQELAALDAQVQVKPFAAWPLGQVELRTQALDLAALSSAAPRTRLTGRATLRARELGQVWQARVEFDNLAPGRWDEGRLPVRRLVGAIQTPSSEVEQWQATGFEVVFAGAPGAAAEAGRWRGTAGWRAGALSLDTQLADVQPQQLDRRAPAMRVSGPLQLGLTGWPSPAAGAGAAGSPTRPSGAKAAGASGGPSLAFQGTLQGSLDARPQPVTLSFDGRASAREFALTRLRAASGPASAQLGLTLQRGTGERWQVRSEGRLERFDPLVWFPGSEGSGWRRGPHRLDASWTLDLGVPAAVTALPPLQWLPTLQGEGALELRDSVVAGVPLRARLLLAQDPSASASARNRFEGRVQLADNLVSFDGTGDALGDGETDRLSVQLEAPNLGALAPLAGLHPALARWTPQAGSAQGQLAAQGRWPGLRGQARVRVAGLRAAELAVERGTLEWRIDGGRDLPLALQAEVLQARIGALRAGVLRADLRGTLRAHQLSLDVAAPLQPPPLLARILGLQPGSGTQALLRGSGSWDGEAEGGGRWRGTLERLSAGVWDGGTERRSDTVDASWLDARALSGEVRLGRNWEPVSVQAAAGGATLAGGVPLRWDEVRWRAHAGHPDLQLRAEIAPVAIAPFLQRAGTGLRWSGNLRMGARVDVRAGERFEADIALRRHEGDLQVLESGTTPQPMGLSAAEFTLSAREGVWRIAPLLAGSNVGRVSGAVTVRTQPADRWPRDDAPLEGALNLQVPQLGVWASWLPPGWRIGGELATTARLGGTVGAPQVTGELQASGVAVRNLLQGVSFSDGELLVTLEGETARIQRFSLRGGEGTLVAEGSASLGASPALQLRARASRFRLIGRVDRQLVASGDGQLAIRPDALRASGRLAIDSGFFDLSRRDAPALDDDVTVRQAGQAEPDKPAPAPVPPLMRNAQVALDIGLGEQVRLRGFGVDTGLRGQLKVSTPGGRLAVNGAVRTEDGTYTGYGQKLEIERGVLTLTGPLESARLDILALRPKLDMRVGVAITGPVQAPRVKLYSDPEMAETEKLSWLLLGRGSEGLGRADTALLQRAATALLSGQGEGPTEAILRALGLDDLSLRQSSGDTRDTIITLGKQLSRRWYVGYERGVNATAGTFQLVYRIAQRFTLRAQSGLENSLDLIWVWRFDEPLTPRPHGP